MYCQFSAFFLPRRRVKIILALAYLYLLTFCYRIFNLFWNFLKPCQLISILYYLLFWNDFTISWIYKFSVYWFPSCSWHQPIKQPILFTPIFSTKFSQFELLKKITNILSAQNKFFLLNSGMKSLFTDKIFGEKIGENKIRGLVFRCHELYHVQLIEHPFLQIPNILFVYSLSIFCIQKF